MRPVLDANSLVHEKSNIPKETMHSLLVTVYAREVLCYKTVRHVVLHPLQNQTSTEADHRKPSTHDSKSAQ